MNCNVVTVIEPEEKIFINNFDEQLFSNLLLRETNKKHWNGMIDLLTTIIAY